MPITGRNNFFFDIVDVNRNFDTQGFDKTSPIIFPFTPTSIMISNESNEKTLYFSFNGVDVNGILFEKETPITFDGGSWTKLFLAREDATVPIKVRVWAWRR